MVSHSGNDPVSLMQAHGIRPTANRIRILRTLSEAGRPLSMLEIETDLESVDKSIISRTLAAFREKHLLHILSDGSESARYEICYSADAEQDTDRHIHFHCDVCGRTYCFEDMPVPSVRYPEGFALDHGEYIGHGVCPECGGFRSKTGIENEGQA